MKEEGKKGNERKYKGKRQSKGVIMKSRDGRKAEKECKAKRMEKKSL